MGFVSFISFILFLSDTTLLINRPFPEEYVPTTGNRYAVNVVNQPSVSALLRLPFKCKFAKALTLCYAICIN